MTNQKYSRFWLFTLNNPDADELFDLLDAVEEGPQVSYLVYQLETGEEGTPHYQGYLELVKGRQLSFVKSLLPRAHWEMKVAQSTAEQCKAYCTKQEGRLDGPWEYGSMKVSEQGKRRDLDELQKAMKNGLTEMQFRDEFFPLWAKHPKLLARYKAVEPPKPRDDLRVILCYGAPGTGKSTWAHTKYPDAWVAMRSKWFEGYEGQREAIFDDFDGSWYSFSDFKRYFDHYKCMVEIKGSAVHLECNVMVITSNKLPEKWYKLNNNNDELAVTRRIHEVLWFNGAVGEFTRYEGYESFKGAYDELMGPIVAPMDDVVHMD